MKKILLTIIICMIPNYTFADWACLIKDKSAEVLLKYMKDNKKIVKNITKSVVKKNNTQSNNSWFFEKTINTIWDEFSKGKNQTISVFNEIFNFAGYYSYFRYFAVFPIWNEVPSEVRRDYKMLDKESKWMISYMKKMNSNWNSNDIIKNACSWVDKNCDLKNMTANEVMWKLIKNNDNILDLYRLTVMWEEKDFNEKLILVDNNFELDLLKYYWKDAISACNSIEGWFFETITKAIENITILNKEWEDWIQMWREAWDLLLWTDPDKEALVEKELLRDYLSEQWISMENQQIIQNNLDEYNQNWLSINNNFIANTISSTFNKIENWLRDWENAIVWDFFEQFQGENTNGSEVETIDYNKIRNVTEHSIKSKQIQKDISELYNEELPYAAAWDISTEKLREKIIETHMSLDDSINVLEKTIEISQKVCNSQDQKRWKCQ